MRSMKKTLFAVIAESVFADDNADASAYGKWALAYDDKRDYDRAISEYSQALRLDPNAASG